MFEFRDKGVEYGSGGRVAEEGCVEEVSAFEDNVWVLLFDESV